MPTAISLDERTIYQSRRLRLQRLFSMFPDGWPGIGLILLRLAVAFSAVAYGVGAVTMPDYLPIWRWVEAAVGIGVGLALMIGFLTPLAGLAAGVGYLVTLIATLIGRHTGAHLSTLASLDLVVMSLSLVLLGPGAFSLDARLFGRREIVIPHSRTRTGDDVRD